VSPVDAAFGAEHVVEGKPREMASKVLVVVAANGKDDVWGDGLVNLVSTANNKQANKPTDEGKYQTRNSTNQFK